MVYARHSGIDLDFIKECLNTDKFKAEYEKIKEQCKNKYVIGSVDRLSPLSGVIEKLAGYEKFLEKYPDLREGMILIQVT
jgi:trehalose-6-phosphate synthase